MDGNLNFYSVASDGRVVTWKLVKVGLCEGVCGGGCVGGGSPRGCVCVFILVLGCILFYPIRLLLSQVCR